jgi:hypothetical protein
MAFNGASMHGNRHGSCWAVEVHTSISPSNYVTRAGPSRAAEKLPASVCGFNPVTAKGVFAPTWDLMLPASSAMAETGKFHRAL